MIELVFCEIDRPRPDLEHFASFFPGAAITYKTEKDLPSHLLRTRRRPSHARLLSVVPPSEEFS